MELHQGAPGQMTWLEDAPPWLCPAYRFASVIVRTENKNVTISDRFWHSQRRWRPVFWGRRLKKVVNFFEEKVHPRRKSWLCPWLRVTWLEDFLTSKWPGSCTALAPPLEWNRDEVMHSESGDDDGVMRILFKQHRCSDSLCRLPFSQL